MTGLILALDLALRTGWALGTVKDECPESGSIRWAKEGASMAKVFSECRRQLRDFLSMNDVSLVVFESPLAPVRMQGLTNINTIRTLIGLCAVVEELLYTLGTYDVREASVGQVRAHFLGSNRIKRPEAKKLTIRKCRTYGWDPIDDNAADALALWDYQRSLLIEADLFKRAV